MSDEMISRFENSEKTLELWRSKEKKALELINIAGSLRFDHSIDLVLFRNDLFDVSPSRLISNHLLAKNYIGKEISLDTTLDMARYIRDMKGLSPAKIDIGRLAIEWESLEDTGLDAFLEDRLKEAFAEDNKGTRPKDVVLYGFGRIGRLLARRIISHTGKGEQLRLKAIVIRPKMADHYEEALKRMSLFQKDSVHGDFPGDIVISKDGRKLVINGNAIDLIYAGSPEEVDYTSYGLEDVLVIDNTGVWRDKAGLSRHLRPGASQVILTAPGKDIFNIVHGANHRLLDENNDEVISAASCTTNAIVPVIGALKEKFEIEKGHIETIHAYTSDQNLLDNFHKKSRRGRGAAINMVLTSTGAASAVSKVYPELKGILTGNAVRVPTPNVSLAILNLTLNRETTVDEVNEILRNGSLHGAFVDQIEYSESTEYVSNHAVGMTSACVVDSPSTIVSSDGKTATIYAWYDNEYGYCCQVVRLAKYFAKVRRYAYY